MEKFNWKYFIGTRLKYIDKEHSSIDTELESIHRTFTSESLKICGDTGHVSFSEYCIPYVIDPKNLSDEQWIYIFGFEKDDNIKIEKNNDRLWVVNVNRDHTIAYYVYEVGVFSIKTDMKIQQIIDRMHECHSTPDFDKLLKAGLIEDAGDTYG